MPPTMMSLAVDRPLAERLDRDVESFLPGDAADADEADGAVVALAVCVSAEGDRARSERLWAWNSVATRPTAARVGGRRLMWRCWKPDGGERVNGGGYQGLGVPVEAADGRLADSDAAWMVAGRGRGE